MRDGDDEGYFWGVKFPKCISAAAYVLRPQRIHSLHTRRRQQQQMT